MSLRFLLLFIVVSTATATATAEVVRVEVKVRSDVGTSYEQIIGRLHFEIDPALAGNAVIADVELAPVNAAELRGTPHRTTGHSPYENFVAREESKFLALT